MKKIYNSKAKRKNVHLSEMKTLRFTPDEILKIEKDCNLYNEKFSTYARKKILNIPMKEKIEIDKIIEIKRIGNNLNQLAKLANQRKSIKIEVLQILKNIEDEIKKI